MFELVAIGSQEDQRWKKTLVEGKVFRLGRAPANGWPVTWDLRISREHCDVSLNGNRLYVRCLDTAMNPAYHVGDPVREFSIGPGEAFRIGQTTFRLDAAESMQTLEEEHEDDTPFAILRAAQQSRQPAPKERPLRNELDSIRGHLSELKAKVEEDAGVKRARTDEEKKSKSVELDALRKQIELLKAEMSAALKAQESQRPEPPPEKEDPAVGGLQDEIEQLRGKVESQEIALRKATELLAKPADEPPTEPALEPDATVGRIANPSPMTDNPVVEPAAESMAESEARVPEAKPKNPLEAMRARLEKQISKADNDEPAIADKKPSAVRPAEPVVEQDGPEKRQPKRDISAESSEPRPDGKPRNPMEAMKAHLAKHGAGKKRDRSSGDAK